MSKKGKKPMKKFLTAGVVAVVLCIAMLAGTTLAWFTDVVKSDENYINAGDLSISATYRKPESPNAVAEGEEKNLYTVIYGKDSEGKEILKNLYFPVTNDDEDNENSNEYVIDKVQGTTSVFDEMIWEPGRVGARLITVENKGDFAAQVYLALKDGKTLEKDANGDLKESEADMSKVIWFEVLRVDDTTNKTQDALTTGHRLGNFNAYAENLKQAIYPSDVKDKNTTASFILLYGMDEAADNSYKNKSFKATLEIRAIQQRL
jgi:predicted ribosomally synthesized peptide with SipW-like signal peptide